MSTQELIAAALRVADAFDAKTAPEAWMQQELREACAALLAHIQRGAVPEGERVAFESWIENEAGLGAARRWMNTEAYENDRVQDYRTGWIACLEWLAAAAPAPDHSGDATEMGGIVLAALRGEVKP